MFSWLKKWKKPNAMTVDAASENGPKPRAFDIVVSVWSDAGCQREVNEDRGRYVRPGDPAVLARKGVLAVVADGMGGHAAGEVASSMAVEVLSKAYYADSREPHAALKNAFVQANKAIYEAAHTNGTMHGMGTTCTALVLRGNQAFSAHVGDSRLYQVRAGHLSARSEDHSLVMELVRGGLLSHDEARNHEDRNIITRALGLRAEVEIATWPQALTIQEDDWFVLCSDGLHDLVQEDEICQILADSSAHEAGERLVALARERGGHDNITVGLLQVKRHQDGPPARERDTREMEEPQ